MEDSLTQLFNLAQQGSRWAENQALQLAMERLRAVARGLIGGERHSHTLRATALVSEAFMQKLRRLKTPIHNSDHFYSLAAYAMRQVLIEHARARMASKRVPPDAIADLLMTSSDTAMEPEMRLAIRQAFERLAKLDRAAAIALRHCFIEGLTVLEAAQRTGRPPWRVRADCAHGLKWMADQLKSA